jgi:hypothetical protein
MSESAVIELAFCIVMPYGSLTVSSSTGTQVINVIHNLTACAVLFIDLLYF